MDPSWEILFMRSPSRWFRAEGQPQFSDTKAAKYPAGCSFVLLPSKYRESTVCKALIESLDCLQTVTYRVMLLYEAIAKC